MDIYARLKKDHDKQRDLLDRIAQTEGDSQKRRDLWEDIKVELEAHASAEEQVFYAELMSHADGSDKARHSVAEHKEASDLIEELDDMDMSSPGWLKKLKHLKERIEHHVDEEEKEVFPVSKDLINADKAKALAKDFDKRKPAEIREKAGA